MRQCQTSTDAESHERSRCQRRGQLFLRELRVASHHSRSDVVVQSQGREGKMKPCHLSRVEGKPQCAKQRTETSPTIGLVGNWPSEWGAISLHPTSSHVLLGHAVTVGGHSNVHNMYCTRRRDDIVPGMPPKSDTRAYSALKLPCLPYPRVPRLLV